MFKTYLKNNNISIYKLSKKTGISYSSLSDFINKKGDYKNFSFYFYEDIAKALNLNLLQLTALVKNSVFVDENDKNNFGYINIINDNYYFDGIFDGVKYRYEISTNPSLKSDSVTFFAECVFKEMQATHFLKIMDKEFEVVK